MGNRTITFLKNSLILSASTIGLSFVSMWWNVYINAKVGGLGVGIFALIFSVYSFSMTAAGFGSALATTRLTAEELANRNDRGIKKALIFSFIYGLCFSLLTLLIIIIFGDKIVDIFLHSKVSKNCLIVISLSIPFVTISNAIHGYFNAVGRVFKAVSVQFFEQGIKILSCIILISSLKNISIEMICFYLGLSITISEVFGFLLRIILYIYDKNKYLINLNKGNSIVTRFLKIAIPIGASSSIKMALTSTKQMLIPSSLERSGTSCDIAIKNYGIVSGMALSCIYFPASILYAISTLFTAEFAMLYQKKYMGRIKTVVKKIIKIILIISIVFSIFFMFCKDELSMFLFRNNEAGKYIFMLAPCIPVIYLDIIVDGILKGLNKQTYVVGISIIDTIITIALITTILPIFGTTGYIVIIYISEMLNTGLGLLVLRKTLSS